MVRNRAIAAALLSGLVFPGAGQFYLKRPGRGLAFAVPAAMALLLVIKEVLALAAPVVDKLQTGQLPFEPDAILAALAAATKAGENATSTTTLYLLIACWLLSTFDAYIIGNKP